MKRLFEIKTEGVHQYFDNKMYAKTVRDELGGPLKHGQKKSIIIHLGPDHWRYGVTRNPKTHIHNARSGGHGNGFPKR